MVAFEFFADGFDARDLQFVADIFDALDDFLIGPRIVAVTMPVFARVEFIKLLFPIPQRGGRNSCLLFGFAQ